MKGDDRDPFGERCCGPHRQQFHALGAILAIEADNARLLALAAESFGALPRHRLGARTPRYTLRLRAAAIAGDQCVGNQSPGDRAQLISGAGIVGQMLDGDNYALVSPRLGSALVSISPELLKRPYIARYDLIEFAAYTLVTRSAGLVPLHGACVGLEGRGALVLGDTGAGKSTLCMRAVAGGFDFLAEDAVFVTPSSLHATGLPTFMHLRCDGSAALHDLRGSVAVLRAPIIRRRSGVHKFELDMRRSPYRLAPQALGLSHVVILRKEHAAPTRALRTLAPEQVRRELTRTQPYTAGLPGWPAFLRRITNLPAYELRRGEHPEDSVSALKRLFERSPARCRHPMPMPPPSPRRSQGART